MNPMAGVGSGGWDVSRRTVLRCLGSAATAASTVVTGCLDHGEPGSVEVDGWPQYGFDADNTAHRNDVSAPVDDANVEWRFETGGRVLSSPSVVDDVVYVGSWDGHLYAVDAISGDLEWRYRVHGEEDVEGDWRSGMARRVGSSPAVVDDTVLFTAWNGYLYALDAADGGMVWSHRLDSLLRSSPKVYGGTVYVGDWRGDVHAFDVGGGGGGRLWSYDSGADHVYSTPCVVEAGDRAVVCFGVTYSDDGERGMEAEGGGFHAVDAESGDELWRFDGLGTVTSSPAVTDGDVVFGDWRGRVHVVDVKSGEERWTVEFDDAVTSSSSVADGRGFVGDDSGVFRCIELADGSVEWETHLNGELYTSRPSSTTDAVYVGCMDGVLHALDVHDGSILWTLETGDAVRSRPAIVDGQLCYGSGDGAVYMLEEG